MAMSVAAATSTASIASGHLATSTTASPRRHTLSMSSSPSSFLTGAFPRGRVVVAARRRAAAPVARAAVTVRAEAKKNVLIVNTNGGGHAVIGFYLAKDLLAAGHAVTVLTVGDQGSDKMKKLPFSRFTELTSAGGKTVWGDPADVGAAVGGASFDVVLDNNGKDLDAVKPVADWAKAAGVGQFLFISSAGIYKPTDEPPHVEGDAVKESAGHVGVEKYIAEQFGSWASFRPQYMIGSGNNKDCEEWFFDRIVRKRPVPIPGNGMQLTNIAHVRDLSRMLALAVENPGAAAGRIFNCVSDRAVTLDGMARLCAAAAGAADELEIVHYDPGAVGVEAKKAFPFRNMHFYAEPRAAKEVLGWTSTTNLPEDLKERYAEYTSSGRGKKAMSFDLDDKILAALRKTPASVGA